MAIQIISFQPFVKNTLQGFITIKMTKVGLEIRDICLHQKNDSRWIQMPSKPYQAKDGQQRWSYILDFYDKEAQTKFQKATLEALDAFQAEGDRRNGL